MTDSKTLSDLYHDAAMALAYHVSYDMKYGHTLTQLSLDAIATYRAAEAALHAEIDARIAARKEIAS